MIQFNLLGISGSLRAASFNRQLIREAARLMEHASYTEADLDFPLYNGDVEDASGPPVAVQTLAEQIAAAGRAGGARAQYALRLAMTTFRPRLLTGPEVMVAGAQNEFDGDGQLTGAFYLKSLTELMADLRAENANT